jgi:hypothetical protein
MPTEFAAERLALRTPAEIATDIIPDRPIICKFPVIRHFFIFREWMQTGIKPSCKCRYLVGGADEKPQTDTRRREAARRIVRPNSRGREENTKDCAWTGT